VLSKVKFNGIGWLRTHISFTRIGVLFVAKQLLAHDPRIEMKHR
jgi:hypothetical protein